MNIISIDAWWKPSIYVFFYPVDIYETVQDTEEFVCWWVSLVSVLVVSVVGWRTAVSTCIHISRFQTSVYHLWYLRSTYTSSKVGERPVLVGSGLQKVQICYIWTATLYKPMASPERSSRGRQQNLKVCHVGTVFSRIAQEKIGEIFTNCFKSLNYIFCVEHQPPKSKTHI